MLFYIRRPLNCAAHISQRSLPEALLQKDLLGSMDAPIEVERNVKSDHADHKLLMKMIMKGLDTGAPSNFLVKPINKMRKRGFIMLMAVNQQATDEYRRAGSAVWDWLEIIEGFAKVLFVNVHDEQASGLFNDESYCVNLS